MLDHERFDLIIYCRLQRRRNVGTAWPSHVLLCYPRPVDISSRWYCPQPILRYLPEGWGRRLRLRRTDCQYMPILQLSHGLLHFATRHLMAVRYGKAYPSVHAATCTAASIRCACYPLTPDQTASFDSTISRMPLLTLSFTHLCEVPPNQSGIAKHRLVSPIARKDQ